MSSKDLGTIVNDIKPDPEDQKLQAKIQELELSRINLRVSPVLFERLNRVAEFKGTTIEEYCQKVLKDSTEEKIGQPIISGPSTINGSAERRVTGPTFHPGGTH